MVYKQGKFIFLVILLVDLALILSGILVIWNDVAFKKGAIKTTAIITKIVLTKDSDGDTHGETHVKFDIEGKEYRGKLGYWNYKMKEGHSVDIYYDSHNPQNFRPDKTPLVGWVLILLGGLFFVASLILLRMFAQKRKEQTRLLTSGRQLTATVKELVVGNASPGNKSTKDLLTQKVFLQKLVCEYKDPITGQVSVFERFHTWVPVALNSIGASVLVFVDDHDFSKYYIDVDSV
ncbi:MAG: DUF3592 domain-containing protein [Gracilibacteraceae bacterium]|jgi:hypothetical protein|nr:DUF3592 domain-containing protein [Gracilibacteraceae bacterium]